MDTKRTYEGMFLLDAGNSDFEAASEPIRTVLRRNESEILSIKPWDERRLAYDLKGRRRALYVLTYFEADPARIADIEHDCRLNEQILRSLILLRRRLSREQVEAHTPATAKSAEAESRAEAEKVRRAREERAAEEAPAPDADARPARAKGGGESAPPAEAEADQAPQPPEGRPGSAEDQPAEDQDQDRSEST